MTLADWELNFICKSHENFSKEDWGIFLDWYSEQTCHDELVAYLRRITPYTDSQGRPYLFPCNWDQWGQANLIPYDMINTYKLKLTESFLYITGL